MAGIESLACPECGRTARSERALYRSRRRPRWLLAGIAIIALTTYTVTTAQSRRAETWTKYVPTTLYLLTDRTVAQGGPLYQRLSAHAMYDWQARIAFRRMLPINVRQHGYQPHITYPTVWPAGVPVPLVYDYGQDTYPLASIGKTTSVLRDPRTGADLARPRIDVWNKPHRLWKGYAVGSMGQSVTHDAPRLDTGRQSLDIDVELATPWKGSSLVIQRTRAAYAIQTASHTDDLCKPVDTPILTALLRGAMRFDGSRIWTSIEDEAIPRNFLILHVSFGDPTPPFDDVAIGVRIEFLRSNEVVGTARYLVPAIVAGAFTSDQRHLHIEGDWHAILDATLNPEGWTVRVTSDLEAVFSDMNNLKPRYWRGQFTVPLADVARPIPLLPAPCPP